MIEFTKVDDQLKIIIPVAGIEELYRYQKGILGILGRIEIDDCNPIFKEDLKAVYQLLTHLLVDKAFLSRHEGLFRETDQSDAQREKQDISG